MGIVVCRGLVSAIAGWVDVLGFQGITYNLRDTGGQVKFARPGKPATMTKTEAVTMPGEYIDLSSDLPDRAGPCVNRAAGRRFLGIRFNCCGIYARIYINHDETAYEGGCPRCRRPVRINIGQGGSDCRFFEVY